MFKLFISFSQQLFSLLKGRVCVLKKILLKQVPHGEILPAVNILPVFSDQMSLAESLMGNLPLNRKRSSSDFQFTQRAANERKGAQ